MIVICQGTPSGVEMVRAQLRSHPDQVFLSGSREATLKLLRECETFDRLVVITGNRFNFEDTDATRFAQEIKRGWPDAWVIAYTSDQVSGGVDAIVDKIDRSVPSNLLAGLVEANIDDLTLFPDLEALFTRFPWIKRPNR